MPVNRDHIVAEARSWIDVPWRHQGRSREHGVDCAGLIIKVAHGLDLSAYDITNYQRNARDGAFVCHFQENMVEKPLTEMKVGDVILFRDHVFSCHSGIVTMKKGILHFVHAYARYRKVVEGPFDKEWLDKRTHCFEFHGIED